MREPIAAPGRGGQRAARTTLVGVGLTLAGLVLTACSDGGADEADEAAAQPDETTSSPASSEPTSPSASASEDPTPDPEKPKKPKFREKRAGQKAFVNYIIDGWSYSLVTNDPSVLLDASGKKPCRGCGSLRKELKQRDKEGWFVDFPGAEVRRISFDRRGDIQEATAVVNVPASRSYFDDGTFRNENDAHKKAKFLVDIEATGKKKKRHWELVAFSVK